ncbi:MAG: serine hydrolase domain-containing protein [Pyrinomonadaceae bacterium]
MNIGILKTSLFAFAATVVITANVLAQDVASLDKTPTGKRALSYFTAFNSGDDAKLTAFFADSIDAEALKRRGVEPRVAFHKQVRGDFQKLEIKRIVAANEREINVLAQSPSGQWASVTFEIEGTAGKFAGVRVERIDPPAEISKTAAPSTLAEVAPAVDKYLDGLTKAGDFSGTVLIAKDDKPVFSKAYGFADNEKKLANKLDTRFNLGSINKMFTRIAIGQLVATGKLSFSDKLIKVLPDYPNKAAAEKITIGQLVNMTSGIGDFFNEKFEAADKTKIRSQKDYLPFFVNEPLAFEPGTGKIYSNGGYLVLGLIVEKLSGKTYYDYVRENIFKPAGMASSDSYAMDELPANTAVGYMSPERGKHSPNTPMQPARGSSAGGGYSTADDMLRFANALRAKKLVIPDDNGGFPAEFDAAGFAGGSPGVNAVFATNGKTGYTIIVLSNFDPPSAEKPFSQIRDWLKQLQQ